MSLLNWGAGLSAAGSSVATFAGNAGMAQQKADLEQQQTRLADQLATTRETALAHVRGGEERLTGTANAEAVGGQQRATQKAANELPMTAEQTAVLGETSKHNRNTEEASAWVESRDALGNPFLIQKMTGETKRPAGVKEDTDATVGPVAKMIANYDLPPLSSVALLKPYGQRVMAEVNKLNPEYQGDQFQVRKGAKASFASGKNGTLVRQANTATSHIMTLEALGNALETGDVKAANEIKNMLSRQFGGAEIVGYEAAAKMVGDEVNKFIGGGPGASADREDYAKSLSAANSPKARAAVINSVKGLMVGQLHSLRRQYETETKSKDFGDKLEPEVSDLLANPQYALGRNPTLPVDAGSGAAPAAPAAAPSVPKFSDPEDPAFKKLPAGSTFMGPDGVERVKH